MISTAPDRLNRSREYGPPPFNRKAASLLGTPLLSWLQSAVVPACLNWLSIAAEKEKVYFSIQSHITAHQESWGRNSGRNLAAGTEAEVVLEHCSLAFSKWLTQPAFLHTPLQPAQGWHHPHGSALPRESLINKMPHRLVYRPILGKHFLIQAPLPR